MRKEWQTMQVQVVGQVQEVVQGNRGKYSPPTEDFMSTFHKQEPE